MTSSVTPSDRRRALHELRRSAVRRVAGVTEELASIVHAATDVATDDEHDPEGHTIAWERQQLAALLADAEATIERIDAALARIDDGHYGSCTQCGASIADARLELLPATATCVECAGRR